MRRALPTLPLALLAAGALVAAAQPPSPAIKVDQAGYRPEAPKVALVVGEGSGDRFTVRRVADGSAAAEGSLDSPRFDPDSGDRVRAADFTELTTPGRYVLEVEGMGDSWPFDVGDDVYAHALRLAMRSFYGQRCNAAVDLGDEFPGYSYEACHLDGAFHPSSGRSARQAPSGGWHDAGDYGRYMVNSGLSTGTLLLAWELYSDRLRSLVLDIPESHDEVPDTLNEIRWNLDWMRTMQDEDGGVWHKQTSEGFAGFVMPHEDHLTSYVIGTGSTPWKSTCATADFAAVMAAAARAFEPFDREFASSSLTAARRAWTWTLAHPDVLFRNPDGISTGAYGDRDCGDERLWAAAELWRTSREEAYHDYVLEHYRQYLDTLRPVGPPSWASVAPMGLWTYGLGGGPDAEASAAIRKAVREAAEGIVARSRAHPYRISLTSGDFVWGSNGVAANYGVQLLIAHALSPSEALVHAALDNLHYLLGRNTFSLSWVTQVGAHPFQHPHHRPSGSDRNAAPWPGLLAGGPNARPQDPAMQALPSGLPPARMYVDDQASYASNEIAINWNAPLVFLLAGVQP